MLKGKIRNLGSRLGSHNVEMGKPQGHNSKLELNILELMIRVKKRVLGEICSEGPIANFISLNWTLYKSFRKSCLKHFK